ncbi:hypothetical protein LZ554_000084 [Drepanopeziza brunnea f. sp. 'monogermtubi']|nr:hypothetical protein LZ554_000084 [Drepanopeziza brunnea f. sp. 'monogermtubi']
MRFFAARTMMGGVLVVVWFGRGAVAAGSTGSTGTGTGTSTSGALYEMLDMCVAGFAGLLHVRAEVKNLDKNLDLQTFSSALAGIACEPITSTSDARRPYAVGSDTFTDYASAAVRTCNDQKNKCAAVANKGGDESSVTLDDCDEQEEKCTNNASTADPSTIGVAPPPQATPAPLSSSSVEAAAPISTPSSSPPPASPPAADPPAADPPAADPPAAESPAPVLPAPPNLASTELLQPTLHSSDAEFFYFCDP